MAAKRAKKQKPEYCTGTRAKGGPCKARPLKGTARCAAHPVSPGFTRFGSPEQAKSAGQQGGRPRRPRWHEKMAELLDQHGPELVELYIEAARNAVVIAKYEGEVHVSTTPDYGARIQILERLLDRVDGKPRQALDVHAALEGSETGAPLVSIVAIDASDPETRRLAHELLARQAGRPERDGQADSPVKPSRSRVGRRRKSTDT